MDRIQESGESGGWKGAQRFLKRRESFRDLKIYLPVVNWVDGEEIRPLDYEEDILFRIDWRQADLDGIVDRIPTTEQELETQRIQIGLTDYESVDFLATRDLGRERIEKFFDPVYAVRAIVDIVPNPWVAREFIAVILKK